MKRSIITLNSVVGSDVFVWLLWFAKSKLNILNHYFGGVSLEEVSIHCIAQFNQLHIILNTKFMRNF